MFRVPMLICQSSFRFPVSYSTRSVPVHTALSLLVTLLPSVISASLSIAFYIYHSTLLRQLHQAAASRFLFHKVRTSHSLSLSLSLCHSVTVHHFHIAPDCLLHLPSHSVVSTAQSGCFAVHSVYSHCDLKFTYFTGFLNYRGHEVSKIRTSINDY
jgi:hypothetical protein